MLLLPNNCKCSEPTVFPKNWKTTSASIKVDWRIQYYFYDPINKPEGKLFVIKAGINKLKTQSERKTATSLIIKELTSLLVNEGFNPITGKKYILESSSELSQSTGLIDCLNYVFDKIKISKSTRADIKSMMKYIELAATEIGFATIPIREIRRKHIKMILEHLSKNGKLSPHRFNKYRSYLSILFAELVELETVESNFIREIKIQKTVSKIRDVLTLDQRKIIDQHLKTKYYSFWRFTQIFFHSGGRVNELLSIKYEDVDLANQQYKNTIKKGRNQRQVWKPIKDSVLHLWVEVMKLAKPGYFLFNEKLEPSNKTEPIRREHITRRWKVHIKDKLGITADFYSLKHLNLDETAAELNIQDAAAMAGHTSTVITMKHYATSEKTRQDERLKKVGNKFA